MPAGAQRATCTTSDGAAIAFARRAAPSAGAPRIVLLHSLALDRSVWVVEILQDEAEILVGEDDTATPVAMARELHAAIARSTLRGLPAARHLTPIECPGPIAAALRDLLRGGA